MSKSKQMRVSQMQYDTLGQLAKELNISRVEMLNHTILLAKFLVDNKATSVKAVLSDSQEKEILLPMLLGNG